MNKPLMGACVALALLPAAQAADPSLSGLLVEATKLEKSPATMTQSVSVIDQEEIVRGAYTDVVEVLRGLAGVEFKQVGGPGQYTYLKMRGFGAGNVLVVVDGVVLNQAGSGDVGNLLGQLDPASISRIEVLRGPQTVLYGANATAGVIAITTRRGDTPHASMGAELGSLGWKKANASWQQAVEMGEGRLRSSVHASSVDSDGVLTHEGFKDEQLQLALDYSTERLDVGLSLWHADSRSRFANLTEVTRSTGWPTYWAKQLPDPNAFNDTRTGVYRAYLEHHLSDGLSQRLEAGWTRSQRKSQDLDDGLLGHATAPWDGFTIDWNTFFNQGDQVPIHDRGNAEAAHYKDRSTQLDYSLRYFTETLKALGGVERYTSDARQWGAYGELDGEADRKSLYLNGEYALASGLTLAAGVRYDDYDVWGDKATGSVGVNYQLGGLFLFANHGTSYRAPTLQQLFNPTYGSTVLRPESGRTREIGVRGQPGEGGFNWEATAWHAEVKDVIIYDGSIENPRNTWGGYGQYANADRQRTRGIELSFAWALDEAWTLKGNYTYTDSETRKAGKDYARTVQIAPHKANLGLFHASGPLASGVNVYYTDKRVDWTGRDWIDSYVRVDVSARYALSRDVSVHARIENLFDSDAPEGLGYEQPGRYGVVGVEYRFF